MTVELRFGTYFADEDVGQEGYYPPVQAIPPQHDTRGWEAIELGEAAGMNLDLWQQYALLAACGVDERDLWTAFEVGLEVPRQNGKTIGPMLVRELAGLFLWDERLIVHTAHEFKTAQEAFLAAEQLVDGCSDLSRHVKRIRRAHGEEAIELHNGGRLRFLARSGGSGRGFSGDLIMLDEAFKLPTGAIGALLPTMSARPNPQIWYGSSAGMEDSEVLAGVRERGKNGGEALCWLEWAAHPKTVDYDDESQWERANPAIGIRISHEYIRKEREAMTDEDFARERLGIWANDARTSMLPADQIAKLTDPDSEIVGDLALAVDVPPGREYASIAVVGWRADELLHGELIDRRPGTTWAVDELVRLKRRHRALCVILDPGSPAGSLIAPLTKKGVDVELISTRELTQACGALYDHIMTDETVRFIPDPALMSAMDAARKRNVGDAWAWHRRDTESDISPLVAMTVALHGLTKPRKKRKKTGRMAAV